MSNVTLAILCKDEAKYLMPFLRYHKPFFEHAILLDGNSEDASRAMAESFKIRVVPEGELVFDGFDDRRNYLAELCNTDWVFMLDVDERMDRDFMRNIAFYTAPESDLRNEDVVAFRFGRHNKDNGTPFDYHVRLYKPVACEWIGLVHETLYAKETGLRVDQSKSVRGNDLCQTLDGHVISHERRSVSERTKQRQRWADMSDE